VAVWAGTFPIVVQNSVATANPDWPVTTDVECPLTSGSQLAITLIFFEYTWRHISASFQEY
jgi:hypothetical protein